MGNDDYGRMPLADGWAINCEVCDDQRTARVHLPPLQIAGMPKPINIYVDMDAEAVDALLRQLAEIRTQMLPAPKRH